MRSHRSGEFSASALLIQIKIARIARIRGSESTLHERLVGLMINLVDDATTSVGQPTEEPNFVLMDEFGRLPLLMRPHQLLLVPGSRAGIVVREDEDADFTTNDEIYMLLPPRSRMMKDGDVERALNAYRATDSIDLPGQGRPHRIDRIV